MEATFVLHNPSGLHARPASLFVQCAQRYAGTDIFVRKAEREVNARSLLAVLSLGVPAGAALTVRAEGPLAAEAVAALGLLVESGFGE